MSELSDSISRKEPLEKAPKLLTERIYNKYDECNHNYHQLCVCLICDRIIKGTDGVKFVRKSTILKHEHVLSIDYFNKSTNMVHLLLYINNIKSKILIFSTCYYLLDLEERRMAIYVAIHVQVLCQTAKGKAKKAPKFAISSGFAIGQIPYSIKGQLGDKEISNSLAAMISKYRFLISVFATMVVHLRQSKDIILFVNDL